MTVQPYTEGNAPIPNGQPYTTARQRFGIVNQQDVTVVFMPRSRFLELVDECADTIEDDYGVNLLPKLRPLAERMATFPLDAWINEDRGCGCVVGEYLVAADLMKRDEYVNADPCHRPGIKDMLANERDGDALFAYGHHIDLLMTDEMYAEAAIDGEDPVVDAVVFLDGS